MWRRALGEIEEFAVIGKIGIRAEFGNLAVATLYDLIWVLWV